MTTRLEPELRRAAQDRPEGREIRSMFASISHRYDVLNRVLSGFLDLRWRRRAVAIAGQGRPVTRVLDVCTGTGDLALLTRRACGPSPEIVGVDFCPEMLQLAQAKSKEATEREALAPVELAVCDAMDLPFPDQSFDAALVAFGIRNVSDVPQALSEMARVIRTGGRVVILEFSRPRNPVARALNKAVLTVVPWIGRLLSGSDVNAYGYLSRSVKNFGERFDLESLLRDSGLIEVRADPLTLGAVTIFWAVKP